MVAGAALVGKWQIVESGTWPRDHLDLCGSAYLRIDADGTGEMAFGALIASVDGGFTSSGVDFDWNGADEVDQVTGTGWPICATTAASKAKSPMTMATTHPSSPDHGLFSSLLDLPTYAFFPFRASVPGQFTVATSPAPVSRTQPQ